MVWCWTTTAFTRADDCWLIGISGRAMRCDKRVGRQSCAKVCISMASAK